MIRLAALVRLLALLAVDTVRSSVVLAWDVLDPHDHSAVKVLQYRTAAETDLELMLLSICLTLTPGTLTLDVADDRRTLFVHAMYAADPEAIMANIRHRYEEPLLRITRGKVG